MTMNRRQVEALQKTKASILTEVRKVYIRMGYDAACSILHALLKQWVDGFALAAGPSRVRQTEQLEEWRQEVFRYVQERLVEDAQGDTLTSLVYGYAQFLENALLITDIDPAQDRLVQIAFVIRQARQAYTEEVSHKLVSICSLIGVAFVDCEKALSTMMRDAEFRFVMHHT